MTWFWRRRRREAELNEEINSHLAMAARDHEAAGESPREAAYAARREFGNATLVKEVTRGAWGGVWLTDLGKDLRQAVRVLRRRPGFTVVAVLTLALGIGANTGVFTVANAVLLDPGPYPHPERLFLLSEWDHGDEMSYSPFSPPDYAELGALTSSYMQIAAWTGLRAMVSGGGEAEALRGARVTASFFPVLGVQPIRGRLFAAEEDRPGNDDVVLISEAVWRRRFNGDPRAVGTAMTVNGVPRTIVGVIPQEARYLGAGEIWVPLAPTADDLGERGRHSSYLMGLARLKPGVTLEQARVEAGAAGRTIAHEHPSSNARMGIGFVPWRIEQTAGAVPALALLLAASGFVLLIACVNVAGLLLVHAASRERDLAIRTALGAGRARMLRPLLVETAVLAALGFAAALLVSRWVVRLLVLTQGGGIGLLSSVTHLGPDWRVLTFAVAVSALAAVGCGLVVGTQVSPGALQVLMATAGRPGSGGVRGARIRRAFVVIEIALAVILVSGAGLMVKSLGRLLSVDYGFDARHVFVMELPLPARYAQGAEQAEAYRRIVAGAAQVAGVRAAAVIDLLPFGLSESATGFKIEGREGTGAGGGANIRVISPLYFNAMSVPLLAGREFSDEDGPGSPPVVIVNRTMARRYWPGASPLGQRLRVSGQGTASLEVVGVVGSVKANSLDDQAEFYFPYQQYPSPSMWLVARATGDPASVAGPLRAMLRAVDPEQPVARSGGMRQLMLDSPMIVPERSRAIMLAALAALALVLASVGVYGVVSQSAAQRTQEIGVRRTLGASDVGVFRLVLGEIFLLSVVGAVVGLLGAYAATSFLTKLLFRVGPHDPVAFAGAPLLLVVAALAASAVPALRAARVDPMTALRYE